MSTNQRWWVLLGTHLIWCSGRSWSITRLHFFKKSPYMDRWVLCPRNPILPLLRMLSNNLPALFFLKIAPRCTSCSVLLNLRRCSFCYSTLPLIEEWKGVAVFRQGLLHNFSVSDDSIWACGNMFRKCGHNLVFTSFFIRMFKFILYFPLFALLNSLPCFQCSWTCRVYLLTVDLRIVRFIKNIIQRFFE